MDPGFSLASLGAALEPQAESLVSVLGEAFDEIPAVASRTITRQEAADLLLRLAYSHYLLPHPDPERLLARDPGIRGAPSSTSPPCWRPTVNTVRDWDQLYIGGHWVDSTAGDRITVTSPVTEEPFGSAPDATTEDIDRAVAAARLAFDDGEWPHLAARRARRAVLAPLRRHLRVAPRRDGRAHHRRDGIADLLLPSRPVGGAVGAPRLLCPDSRMTSAGRRSGSA